MLLHKKYDRVKDLSEIKVPTLFMCGEFDEATSATVLKNSKMVKGAQFHVLKGCSHVFIFEKQNLVIKKSNQILDEQQ